MKNFFSLLLVVAALAFGYYRWFAKDPDAPKPPEKHIAAVGIYFMRSYLGIPTAHGMTGWTPGQEVHKVPLTPTEANEITVTDGAIKQAVDLAMLTQDMDEAAALRAQDNAGQTRSSQQVAADQARVDKIRKSQEVQAAKDLLAASDARRRAGRVGDLTSSLNDDPNTVSSGAGGGPTFYYTGAPNTGTFSAPAPTPAHSRK